MAGMIEARSIGFRHGPGAPWLFNDLSLTLRKGQTLALLGRNGRGKTTLLRCLAGLLRPTAGAIRNDGHIGYVPQSFAPVFAYSAFDVVLMGRARHVGVFANPTAADRAHAFAALERLGLTGLARRTVTTLSGGERQLVLVARAIASQADVLLLDEPASALDFRNQAMVLAVLRRLADDGMSIVMTTHDPTHALHIADRAILLHGSGRAEEGAVVDICTEPRLSDLYGIRMKALQAEPENAGALHVVADYGSITQPPPPLA